MPKKQIVVKVAGSTFYEGKECDVCLKYGCILVHAGDPLFAYALKPGQYAKFLPEAGGVMTVQVDE